LWRPPGWVGVCYPTGVPSLSFFFFEQSVVAHPFTPHRLLRVSHRESPTRERQKGVYRWVFFSFSPQMPCSLWFTPCFSSLPQYPPGLPQPPSPEPFPLPWGRRVCELPLLFRDSIFTVTYARLHFLPLLGGLVPTTSSFVVWRCPPGDWVTPNCFPLSVNVFPWEFSIHA